MKGLDREHTKPRSMGRRAGDRDLRERLHKHNQLLRVGQTITSEINLKLLFEVIMAQTNEVMETQRSTVFLYDGEKNELWSLVATGMKRNEIRIPADYGVAGWVFQNRKHLIINNAYEDPRFYSEVDRRSGFRTKNILCVPVIDRFGKCIGALQTLNRKTEEFKDKDRDLLTSISYYVAIALENSQLYEEVKSYSEELKGTLLRIETLERVKGQLTKFVPFSVVKIVEQNPDSLSEEKMPKDVSILFIDIEGFTSITECYDQRLVNDMVEGHFSRYLEFIQKHGGEVNETSGDGLMVMFKEGTLKVHARQAVDAGLEIIAENRKLNEEITYPWGNVELHLGINSGRALVGATKMKSLTGERWTYTASGLVTVLAARIGAESSGTSLYVGPETYQYLEERCEYEFVGTRPLKNVKDPVPIYWIKGRVGDC